MRASNAELKAFIAEVKRCAALCNKPVMGREDYRELCGPGFSIDVLKKRGYTFNQMKELAGLPCYSKGQQKGGAGSKKRYEKKPVRETPAPVEVKRRYCNKCDKLYTWTPYNRLICPKCAKANQSNHTDGGGVYMNGNEIYHTIHAEGI